jgi:signal transduction histidine kinase
LLILALRTDWSKPSSLRAVTIQIFTGIVVAFAPGLLLWLTPMVVGASGPGTATLWISTASIALLPFFYVYALYKHRLGASEMRANRALNFYSFLVLYATGFMLVFVTMNRWAQLDSRAMTFSLIVSIVCLFLALMAWAPYQRLLNFLVYGNSYEPGTVIQEFANEIPRAMNRDKLAELISNRVAKSLLIRQSALVQVSESFVSLMYAEHIDLDLSKWERDEVLALLDRAERYIPPDGWSDPKHQWIRLIIPIRLDQQLLGIWLLGKKDPDDFYPQRDINVLSTLANQIAVSMETVRLFETLRSRAEELEHAYLELRRADRLKDEFIRNISHELRTPLTAVLGYSELLLVGESGDLTPGQEELLEIVIQHTHDIIRLVNSIIAMQQAKLRTIKKQPVSVYEVARASIQESQIFAQRQRSKQEAPVEFALKCPEDLPLVLANRAQLSQVFDNLLSNAVKFSPNGGTIEVSARATSHKLPALVAGSDIPKMVERPVIEVCVRDQGIGIPEDEIGHIWEQFYQIDGSATRRFGGTGLGLALARDIIESHGGEIWVESQVGVGSAFYFVLPVEKHLSDPKIQSEEITTSNNNTSLSEITAS